MQGQDRHDQWPEASQMRLNAKTMGTQVEPIWSQIQTEIEAGTICPLGLLALCTDLYLAGYAEGVTAIMGREEKMAALLAWAGGWDGMKKYAIARMAAG